LILTPVSVVEEVRGWQGGGWCPQASPEKGEHFRAEHILGVLGTLWKSHPEQRSC